MQKPVAYANGARVGSAEQPQIDRYGHAIVVIEVGRQIAQQHRELHVPHGQPGHKCYAVFPWKREFWGAGVHTGKHDCPDGGCS